MTYEKILDTLKKAYKKADLKKLGNDDFALEIDIYGEGEGALYVEFKGGVLAVEGYEYIDRSAKIYAQADTIVAIATGKSTVVKSAEDGKLTVEGDFEAAKKLDLMVAPVAKTAAKAPAKKAETKPAAKKTAEKKTVAKKPTVKKTEEAKPAVEETKAETAKTAEKAPTAKKAPKAVK